MKIQITFILYLLIIFGACSHKKTEQQNPNNSEVPTVEAPADTTTYIEKKYINIDDTIKAIKVVYVLNEKGILCYSAMNLDSIINNLKIDYTNYMEVLEEFPKWYKIRITNKNRDKDIFYVLKKTTKPTNSLATLLHYPNYTVILNGYKNSNSEYNEDEININSDTIILEQEHESYNLKKCIHVISKNKSDKYNISYVIQYDFNEILPENPPINLEKYKYLIWQNFSKYSPLEELAKNNYVFPSDSIKNKFHSDNLKILKKKYHLRDTNLILKYKDWESGGITEVEVKLTKGKRLIKFHPNDSNYLRIQRIVKGKVLETNYIELFENNDDY